MRKVVVDPEKKTITAQGGALWADVDTAAAEHGLATVGGTVNHTGIGGLTLGGGYGWLTSARGLAIDNLLEVEFILADGSIVTASETENPDLFWAVRGAGPCFGVATSFTYKAYDQKNQVWAGILIFPPPALAGVIDFANQQLQSDNDNAAMVAGFGAPPPAMQPCILCPVFYNGPEEEAKEFFKPLFELGPIADMTGMKPYPALNAMINPMAAHGGRKSWKGCAFLYPMDPNFAQSVFDDFSAFIQKVPEAAAGTIILLEYFRSRPITKVKLTSTAFANRGDYCNVMIGPKWVTPEADNVCREWSREMAEKFRAEMEKGITQGGVDRGIRDAATQYGNYDGEISFPRIGALVSMETIQLTDM
jgi:hypothetical protein